MDNYTKSMIPVIESRYDNFTQVEKTIADFFLRNQVKQDFSSKNVGQRLFVSEASLSRFAKKCGFHGYREFIYQYEDCLSKMDGKETAIGHVRPVLDIYQEILNKTYNLVDEAQIVRIIRYMKEARRIFVCGKGSSGLAASEMESRFMRVGVDIDSQRDADLMRMQAVFQDEHNLVLGISLSGDTEEVLYLLKESFKRRAKTILFTANNKDSFRTFCSEVVLVPTLKNLSGGAIISPQFPIQVMIDIIYSYYVNQDKYGNERLHDHTVQALHEGKMQKLRIYE